MFQSQAGRVTMTNQTYFSSNNRKSLQCNYHHYLEILFSKCREFEQETAAIEESPASSKTEVSMATNRGPEVKSKKNWWDQQRIEIEMKGPV